MSDFVRKSRPKWLSLGFRLLIAAVCLLGLNQVAFANDAINSSEYLDTDADGTVDTIRWTMDENVTACTYEAGDWSVNTAGTINVQSIDGLSCTGSDAILDISITADSSITGGATNPVISYADAGTPGSVTLTSGAMTAKANVTATDGAAPQIKNATSTQSDGKYGPSTAINITLDFTEAVSSAGLAITLDTGATVNTGALTNQTSFAGNIYTVGATGSGENTTDLSITGITGTIGDGMQPTVNPLVPAGFNIHDNKDIEIDTTAPTVTDANISISGGSGVAGAYIVGDTITATWNNSAGGDNNTDLSMVTANLSGWGGNPAIVMTDTTACGGTLGDNIYEACYTIAGTEGIDATNVNVGITALDDAGNSSGQVLDSTNATVDTEAPTIPALSATMDASSCTGTATGFGGTNVCIVGDTIIFKWDNTGKGGIVNTDIPTNGVSANISNFGGGVAQQLYDNGTNGDDTAGDDIFSYAYTVPTGNIDGNYMFSVTVTDDAGNVTGPSNSTMIISIDNEPPTVTAGCISVSGDTGTGGAFKLGDTPQLHWDDTAGCDNNSDTISAVEFDASDFRAVDTALLGTDTADIWTAGLAGAMDSQDTINNNATVTVYDDAGNSTTVTGTNDYTIDTQLPSFDGTVPVSALKQDGNDPTVTTNIWYYYPGDNLKLEVFNLSETDANDLASVKACIRSINEDDPSLTCTPADFTNPANYDTLTIDPGTDSAELNFDLSTLASWPTQVDGYSINFELTDDAGNIWWTSSAEETFIAAFNVDPKVIYTGTPDIDNATTTDWSTITDFTAVTNLVFNANDGINDVGSLTITGPVDLTTTTAIAELQGLATNMLVSGDQGTGDIDVKIHSANLSIFDTGATVVIYVPDGTLQPGLVVRDNDDAILGYIASGDANGTVGGNNITGITWDGVAQTLTFGTDGFSSFGADQTSPTATISPVNGSTNQALNVALTVSFDEKIDTGTFTYTLSPDPGGTSVSWNPTDTVATIAHNNFSPNTSYTLTVTGADDMVGNSTAGGASTFTTEQAGTVQTGGTGGGSLNYTISASSMQQDTTSDESSSDDQSAESEDETGQDGSGQETYEEEKFVDMENHWAEDYIQQAYEKGFVQGYEDKTFKPDQQITRAEVAKLIAMLLEENLSDEDCEADLFSDVSCESWYGTFVTALYMNGIVEGYANNTFGPNEYISRAEALKMLILAKGLQETDISDIPNIFSDINSSDWYYEIVMIAYKLSIVEGYGDGTFRPNNSITRAEFTKILMETINKG